MQLVCNSIFISILVHHCGQIDGHPQTHYHHFWGKSIDGFHWFLHYLLNYIFSTICARSATIISSEPRLPCPALWSSQCHCYCTVGVPRIWWRSPSEQLYHQWDQHYDNHLTNQWNYTYSTIQCKTDYRGCCYKLHWNQQNCHVDLLWRWGEWWMICYVS